MHRYNNEHVRIQIKPFEFIQLIVELSDICTSEIIQNNLYASVFKVRAAVELTQTL